MWVVSEGNVTGWLSMPTVLVGALSVALLVAFVAIEKRTSEPVLRFDIFRDRSLLGANLTLLLVYAGLVACVFTLSFFLQRNLSLSSVRSGFAFIPTSVVLIVATSFSSRLASRMGMRFLVAYASIAMAAGFFLYSRMGSTDQFIIPFLAVSVLIGLFGLALPILFTVGVAGVPLAHRGAASGLSIPLNRSAPHLAWRSPRLLRVPPTIPWPAAKEHTVPSLRSDRSTALSPARSSW